MAEEPVVAETGLQCASVYERRVPVSIERVWENVHDWEHLPWLHSSSFDAIELEDSGPWGWKARIGSPGGTESAQFLIELRLEEDEPRYHTRTLEGPGAGGDIVTTLEERGPDETGIRVEFWIAEEDEARAQAIGQAMVGLYTNLWDEDEAMMVERQAFLDRKKAGRAAPAGVIDLGPENQIASALPLLVQSARGAFRILPSDSGWVAMETTCPHLGGPLAGAAIEDAHLICPWHGYRFSTSTGRNPDGRPCRLPTPIAVDVENGQALLRLPGRTA